MRIAVVSHSLAAERQQIFFDHFGTLPNTHVVQIPPKTWGSLRVPNGFHVNYPGDNAHFTYDEAPVLAKLKAFWKEDPSDVLAIYCQEELSSACAAQCAKWAKHMNAYLVYFVWENQQPQQDAWLKADAIIAGNREAAFLHKTKIILPQVGLDAQTFFITDATRPYEVLFPTYKRTREKGYDLFAKLPFKKLQSGGSVAYESMGGLYRQSKIVVTPSRDTPMWKEQFAPFVNVEGLFSGCDVVASDSDAMQEWLDGIPGVSFFPRDGYDALEAEVGRHLKGWTVNREGRKIAVQRFSKEEVAVDLQEVFLEL